MLILVQLADLHTGGAYFKQEIFDTIISEVNNNLKPDVTLITGDLTNEGLISQFEQANIEIEAQRRLSQCNTSTFYQEEDK
jgi:3',5'-cyclic AMP phosphodiesterase CpdA